MNAFSARDSDEPARASSGYHERPHDDREHGGERRAVQPVCAGRSVMSDRQAQRDEDDDLGQRGQRALEALDLALVRHRRVAEEKPGDEDGQEAGAVGQRRHGVQDGGQRRAPNTG